MFVDKFFPNRLPQSFPPYIDYKSPFLILNQVIIIIIIGAESWHLISLQNLKTPLITPTSPSLSSLAWKQRSMIHICPPLCQTIVHVTSTFIKKGAKENTKTPRTPRNVCRQIKESSRVLKTRLIKLSFCNSLPTTFDYNRTAWYAFKHEWRWS